MRVPGAGPGGWTEPAGNRRALRLPEHLFKDDDGDGDTNLDEWLHTFAADVEEGR